MRIYKNIHWLIYPLFLLSCARQTTPTGGPKDSIPPVLISSLPKHEQINFKGQTIQLEFSETVILNNPREQLIVTPDIGKEIDITAKKNTVTIALDEDLKDSTTYSINFRESVQDITEKNPAQRLKLAFSTGPYVDSLSIEGTVYDLLETKKIKDATLGLYQSDTFNIFKHRPTYITKSDEKGNFKLENLKPGKYFLYGLEDKNKNLIVDGKTESYGFQTDTIDLKKNITNVAIPLIRLDSRPLKLTSARPYGTYFNIKTTKSLTDFKILNQENEPLISSFGEDLTNVRIYNTFENKDSLQIRFIANDSIDNSIDTVLYVKFSDREVKPENFNLTLNDFQVIGTKGVIEGKINFSKPLLAIDFDSIFYRIDSVKTIPITSQDIQWDTLNNQLVLKKTFDKTLLPEENPAAKKTNFKNDKSTTVENQFYLGVSAFVSIELDSSKKTIEKLIPSKLEDTGIIFVDIQTAEPSFVVQLLTKDFQLITSKANAKKITFEDLKPGDYQIRLIIDTNKDGKWNPGNFYQKEKPEPVAFYKNEKEITIVNLKANWELGPLLIKY